MNQRASHFSLGNSGQSYGSVYKKDYDPKQAQKIQYNFVDPFQGSSINPPNSTNFKTTNKATYTWQQAEKAALDENKLKQLRGHHFKLGGYNPDHVPTTNNVFYDRKQLSGDANKNQEESKNKMRAHHHDFKQQPFTNFKSTYNQQYTPKQGQPNDRKPVTAPENAIVFGNHKLPMLTTNAVDYTRKGQSLNKPKATYQQASSLILGQHSNDMQTTNQKYFEVKQIQKNQLPQSTMKELRATHFNLGGLPNSYARESDNYKKFQNSNPNFKIPQYQVGSWMPKDAKFQGKTTNHKQLPPRQLGGYKKAEPIKRAGFSLGKGNNNYTTQFSSSYNPKGASFIPPVQPPKGNISIGSDVGTYITQHKANYKNRDMSGLGQTDTSGKYRDNVNIGGQRENDAYITVYQDEYRPDQQHKSHIFHKYEP